jgi:mRNA-degrading endonuclease RelE of RelBE toxin-antitoxin system
MKHRWHLEYHSDVKDQLRKLPPTTRMAVFGSIRELLVAENPKMVPGVKKLVDDPEDTYRQRQGDYRILFRVHPGKVAHLGIEYVGCVEIIAVKHRSQAYK